MDGDFEALISVPFEKDEFTKAFLIGEGFIIKEKDEDWMEPKKSLKLAIDCLNGDNEL